MKALFIVSLAFNSLSARAQVLTPPGPLSCLGTELASPSRTLSGGPATDPDQVKAYLRAERQFQNQKNAFIRDCSARGAVPVVQIPKVHWTYHSDSGSWTAKVEGAGYRVKRGAPCLGKAARRRS